MKKFLKLFSGNMDMTTGNLFTKIAIFAVPICLTMVFQLLYQTIDLISVQSWGGGDTSMGAIAANGPLIYLITVVFTNMSQGASVAITNAKGAKNKDKASRILHTSILLSLIGGILLGFIGVIFSDDFLRLMGTEEAYLDLATKYLRIYFMGCPFLMVNNYAAQNMRAIGDSKTPFIILAISGLLNILFDFIFVRYGNMDVEGVAIATILAQAFSAIGAILVFFLYKNSYIKMSWRNMKMDKESVIEILKLGLPAGIQGFFFALPNTFIQAKLYTIDPGNIDLANGSMAASQVENYLYAIVSSIFTATMSFVAENYGANKKENIKKVYWYSIIWNAIVNAVIILVILLLHKELMGLFVTSKDAIEYGKQRLFVIGFTYFLDGIMDINASTLRGCRKSTFPMINTMIFCSGFRILFLITLFNLDFFHTVSWLYSVFPISWVMCIISSGIAMKILMPKAYEEMKIYSKKED